MCFRPRLCGWAEDSRPRRPPPPPALGLAGRAPRRPAWWTALGVRPPFWVGPHLALPSGTGLAFPSWEVGGRRGPGPRSRCVPWPVPAGRPCRGSGPVCCPLPGLRGGTALLRGCPGAVPQCTVTRVPVACTEPLWVPHHGVPACRWAPTDPQREAPLRGSDVATASVTADLAEGPSAPWCGQGALAPSSARVGVGSSVRPWKHTRLYSAHGQQRELRHTGAPSRPVSHRVPRRRGLVLCPASWAPPTPFPLHVLTAA